MPMLLSAAAQCCHAAVGVVERLQRDHPVLLKQYEQYGSAKVAIKIPTEAEMVRMLESQLVVVCIRLALECVAGVTHDATQLMLARSCAQTVTAAV